MKIKASFKNMYKNDKLMGLQLDYKKKKKGHRIQISGMKEKFLYILQTSQEQKENITNNFHKMDKFFIYKLQKLTQGNINYLNNLISIKLIIV